jgi:hypothetical protein
MFWPAVRDNTVTSEKLKQATLLAMGVSKTFVAASAITLGRITGKIFNPER